MTEMARRFGGLAWQRYDTTFRKEIKKNQLKFGNCHWDLRFGCSNKNVLLALSTSTVYQRLNCKFSNKAYLLAVIGECVVSPNQIDLIHMNHVNYDGWAKKYTHCQ